MRIAIVGLGTAGACMLDSLVQALGSRSDVTLTLYDPAADPWSGRVFQPDSDWILANAPVQAMSLRYGDTTHAARWLVEHGWLQADHSAETFLPRAVYGRYIAEHSSALLGEMRRRGWHVELVRSAATSLERTRTGYTVGTSSRRDEHDHVILCAGGSVLADRFGLDSDEGYVADPYPARERLRDIPAGAAVGIVGSGLTAVDVAVTLHARGHAGPVRMYSRSGVLPLVRRPGPDWSAEHLTTDRISRLSSSPGGLRLADVERLFDQEVQAWGGEPRGLFPPPPLEEPLSWLRRQAETPHDRRDLGTFIFQKSIPTVWGDVWYALAPHDKRRILASPRLRDIMSRCCPMPRVNAEKLIAMLDSGQLSVHGGVEAVAPGPRGFRVRLATSTQHADYIVNAVTPAEYGVHPGAEALVASAVDHGVARRHDCGGLEVAPSGKVHGGRRSGGVYAVGDLTRGAFFFIFGLPALVRRAADVAAAIYVDSHQRSPRSVTMEAARPAAASHARVSLGGT